MNMNQREIKNFERIDQPDINLRIVLLFLEKLEIMTAAERGTIKKTIDILNNPIFISGQETPHLVAGEDEKSDA